MKKIKKMFKSFINFTSLNFKGIKMHANKKNITINNKNEITEHRNEMTEYLAIIIYNNIRIKTKTVSS